jgi:transcriptional regulator with XRE-family HTH domain
MRAKLSQGELAKRAGLAQSTLAGLETAGGGSSKTATLAEICGVRVRWLERGEDPMLDDGTAAEAATGAKLPSGAPDYRAITLALLEAVEKSKSPISVRQFVTLVEETYKRLGGMGASNR